MHAVKYLVPLSAHKKDTEHIQHFHFIHDLMDDLHRLGQSMSQRACGQGTLIWGLWERKKKKKISKFMGFKQEQKQAAQLTVVLPVLLCSASSVAICMRASRTRALSSQVYQSSSSCRKLAPVASDTFLVASLHSRSMKPGMFSRVTVGKHELIIVFFPDPFYSHHHSTQCSQFNQHIMKTTHPGWPLHAMD